MSEHLENGSAGYLEILNISASTLWDRFAAGWRVSPGSQLDLDNDEQLWGALPMGSPSRVAYQSMVATVAGLQGVRAVLNAVGPFHTATFGPSLRAAMLPALRALYVLYPDDRETRVAHATEMGAAEAKVRYQSLQALRDLDEQAQRSSGDAWNPDQEIEEAEREWESLKVYMPKGQPPSDTQLVGRATAMLEQHLGAGGGVQDAIRRMWRVYSADAHGWSWQYGFRDAEESREEDGSGAVYIRREIDTPRVLADGAIVATVANVALSYWDTRSQLSDAEDTGSNENVG